MHPLWSTIVLLAMTSFCKRLVNHQETATANLRINGTLKRLTNTSNVEQSHPVNWTSPHPLMFKSGHNISGLSLPDNAQLAQREIVSRVVSDIQKPKKIRTKPEKVELFALTNIDNNNWTSFDYNKVQLDWILKSKLSNVKKCPIQIPFYNGTNCISCPQGTYFDVQSKQCGGPGQGLVFDPNLHTFVAPETHFKTRVSAGGLDGTGMSKNEWNREIRRIQQSQYVQCPQQKPYFDNITCVSCRMPNPIFNIQTLLCTHCQSPEQYSRELNGCYVLGGDKQKLNIIRSIGRIFTTQN